ncbi:MAG: septum site-determining protein MinC [Gammaproteobacteria bacterium]|nr:septum site-determining protein MinC [Gammaproteobacteria bacterium]
MNSKSPQNSQPAFQLKGSVLTLSVLQLLSLDYGAFQQQLEETIKKNPNFFEHMPIIIDLQKLYALDNDINFVEINSLLRKHGLVPVGVTNANPKQVAEATQVGLGILPNVKTTQSPKVAKINENAKIISQPVRSGQQIYAKNCDLIILSSVSNGAEILADGNIHVYGSLRGRAIAGAAGEANARIFCHKLEAELVAIAGHYKLQEDIEAGNHVSSTQVFLENDQLVIASIS